MSGGASASAHDLEARVRAHLAGERAALRLGGLPTPARAALVAAAVEHTTRPVWVVTATLANARALRDDIATFLAARSLDLPVRVLPGWPDPPDGRLSPDAAGTFERLGALTALVAREHSVVVVPIQALHQRVLPRSHLEASSLELRPGGSLVWEELIRALTRGGYARLERVESVGELAVRGGVVDVFPPDHELPLRIELEGDAIESLRTFDPDTQRSLESISAARIGPCREVLFTPESIERAAIRIKERADRLGVAKLVRDALIDTIRAELRAPGIEAYWPAFEDERVPVAAYREPGDPLIVDRALEIARTWGEAREALRRWEEGIAESGRLYFPADAFWDLEGSVERLAAAPPAIELDPIDKPSLTTIQVEWGRGEPPVPKDVPGAESFDPVAARFAEWLERDLSPLVLASSEGQAARLEQLFAGRSLAVTRVGIEDLPSLSPSRVPAGGTIRIAVGSLSAGWRWPELGIVVVVDEEIFGRKRHGAARRRRREGPSLDLGELSENDHVVHRDFGIGIYRGLKTMAPGGVRGDFLQLEYAGGDRLYLPVDRIERVERYVGGSEDGSGPALSKLGGAGWARAKERVHRQVLEMAGELANLYAARKLVQGHAFTAPDAAFHEFAAAFPFE
ncbi:MAG: CarD family transcriptional regulator, partial [bacterium]